MIAFESAAMPRLLLRRGSGGERLHAGAEVSLPVAVSSTIVLQNASVKFTFERDDLAGLRLRSFQSLASAQVWQNVEPEPFRVIAFDPSVARENATFLVQPVASKLASVVSTSSTIVATWEGLEVGVGGSDRLDVTLTIALGESWLDVQIGASWRACSRFAVDSLVALPLRVAPKNMGGDFAVLPNVFGLKVSDPIRKLRYDPSGGKSTATFGAKLTNTWSYPSGRGCKMPVWGYYDAASLDGWMAWLERGGREHVTCCYQSDGARMLWEVATPQPNSMTVGNGGSVLASSHRHCVRPFVATQAEAWWDMGAHYKARLAATAPSWLPPLLVNNTARSAAEKRPIVLFCIQHSEWSGSSSYLVNYAPKLRTDLGLTADTHFHGTGHWHSNLWAPYEPQDVGDDRESIVALHALDIFLSKYEAGLFMPTHWSIYQWKPGELRWWNNVLEYRAKRLSRAGKIAGGGADVRAETISGLFDRERTFPVVSWDSGTKTATVTGNPSTSGFTAAALSATLVPASASARLAGATVHTLGASTIKVTGDFVDGTGAVVTPTASHSIVVSQPHKDVEEPRDYCPHAILGSSLATQAVKDAVFGGRFDVWRATGGYVDVYSDVTFTQPTGRLHACYDSHAGWSKLDGGYVAHPQGGGSWWRDAHRNFLRTLIDDARARQVTADGEAEAFFACEDLDETFTDTLDYCWHVAATTHNWRDLRGRDPLLDGVTAIPLFHVVHAGRAFCRAPLNEMTSALAIAVSPTVGNPSPRTDAALHAAYGYYIGSEWAHGMNLPCFTAWSDNTNGTSVDLYDEAIYVPVGPVSTTVRQLRDMHRSMVRAEQWCLRWLRYGELLAPLPVNAGGTSLTTGLADQTAYSFWFSSDFVYPRASFPRVMHAAWRDPADGSVCLIFVNWTGTAAGISVDVDFDALGFGDGVLVHQSRRDSEGIEVGSATYQGGQEIALALTNVPAFSIQFVVYSQVVASPGAAQPRQRRATGPGTLPLEFLQHRVDVVMRESAIETP